MKELINELKIYAEQNFVPIIEDPALECLLECVKQANPKSILEIGTAIGYSGLAMLSVCSSETTLLTVDINVERLTIAENYFKKAGVHNRVKVVEEDANYLITLLESQFDFIFLDGPKGHYQEMLPHLLKVLAPNGMIFVDDVGYHGWVDDGNYPKHKHRTIITNMRNFLSSVQENKQLISKRIDVGQGVLIIKKCQNLNY